MKKSFISFLSLILMFSFMPISSLAKTDLSEDEIVNVTFKELGNTKTLVEAINELDQNLNMENLSLNSQEEINHLSAQAKELYDLIVNFENQKSDSLTGNDALLIFSKYLYELDKSQEGNVTMQLVGGINYEEYKISNAKIQELNGLIDLNTGFWGVAIALAKVFSYSPTVLTLMLAAVPVLGIAVINKCNSKGKGIIITKVGSGATNSYFCDSQ